MKRIQIYDPAMCCSTGVCGPEVDQDLVGFAGFLQGLDSEKFHIERYNLSQQPEAYVNNIHVSFEMQKKGVESLPLIFIDEKLHFSGAYPKISEFKNALSMPSQAQIDTSGGCCTSDGCC